MKLQQSKNSNNSHVKAMLHYLLSFLLVFFRTSAWNVQCQCQMLVRGEAMCIHHYEAELLQFLKN